MCIGAGAHMPDALEYKLERPAFVDTFKAVQHTLICRSIGDANVYNAYFEKQCTEQNAQTLALRASLETLTQLDDVVNDLVKQYLGMTHGKCQMLLDILTGIDSFDMRVFNGFAVCVIDGVIVRTGLCMRDKQTNVSFVISLKFKYFLFTFWLVKHFHSICVRQDDETQRESTGRDRDVQRQVQRRRRCLQRHLLLGVHCARRDAADQRAQATSETCGVGSRARAAACRASTSCRCRSASRTRCTCSC